MPSKKEPNEERPAILADETEPRKELDQEQHHTIRTETESRNKPSEPRQGILVNRPVSQGEPSEPKHDRMATATPSKKELNHERHGTIVMDAAASGEPSQERHGTIVLTEDPQPTQKLSPQPVTMHRPTSADLQRQVKTLCGKQAREVAVMVHIDGSLLVRVKVPNRKVEDQLSRKILSLPEMQSPRVRLLMEVEP